MRNAVLVLALLGACKFDPLPSLSGDDAGGGDDGGGSDACTGLACMVPECQPGMETKLIGTVMLPNGTTPMAGIDVYVPNRDPGAFTTGATCATCGPLPGDPIVKTRTNERGQFELINAPAGPDIPLVITIGKWRRQMQLPMVRACETTMLDPANTRLPKSRTDLTQNTRSVDMPKIAISTGNADALECLVRKIGVADTEFGTLGGMEAIHLYATGGQGSGVRMSSTGSFAMSQALWSTTAQLSQYDVVMLSCEGGTNAGNKPQSARDAMKTYVDTGGRLFASHYHNIWIGGDPATGALGPVAWRNIAMFSNQTGNPVQPEATIDMSHAPGMAFAMWQQSVTGGTLGRIPVETATARTSIQQFDQSMALQWSTMQFPGGLVPPQNFSFATPVEMPAAQRCGRVTFSDTHVSASSTSQPTQNFPGGCAQGAQSALTPQELALVYLLFQTQTCVGAP